MEERRNVDIFEDVVVFKIHNFRFHLRRIPPEVGLICVIHTCYEDTSLLIDSICCYWTIYCICIKLTDIAQTQNDPSSNLFLLLFILIIFVCALFFRSIHLLKFLFRITLSRGINCSRILSRWFMSLLIRSCRSRSTGRVGYSLTDDHKWRRGDILGMFETPSCLLYVSPFPLGSTWY